MVFLMFLNIWHHSTLWNHVNNQCGKIIFLLFKQALKHIFSLQQNKIHLEIFFTSAFFLTWYQNIKVRFTSLHVCCHQGFANSTETGTDLKDHPLKSKAEGGAKRVGVVGRRRPKTDFCECARLWLPPWQ